MSRAVGASGTAPPTPSVRGSSRTGSTSPNKSSESTPMGPPLQPAKGRVARIAGSIASGSNSNSGTPSARPSTASTAAGRISTMSTASTSASPLKVRNAVRAGMTSARASTATISGAPRSPVKKLVSTQQSKVPTFKSSGAAVSKIVVPFPTSGQYDGAEPIKAFLRLRPALDASKSAASAEPYIEVTSSTDIIMVPPKDNASGQTAQRSRQAQHYSFNKIFQPAAEQAQTPSAMQADFFRETCLPMVSDLLNAGQSGLYCTYGVTNSGKSYTIHGGSGAGEAGVLPRTLDTIFNSLDGLLSTSRIRPVGLSGVELVEGDESDSTIGDVSKSDRLDPLSLPPLRKRLLSNNTAVTPPSEYEREQASVKVDRNYRYSVWISYLEVYNEKLYDLLDVAPAASASGSIAGGMSRSDSIRRNVSGGGSNWSLAAAAAAGLPSSASSAAVSITRHALQLKNDSDSAGDPEGQCKYAVGLSEHKVSSAEEARALIRRGEQNRAVFGTMANRVSSRSHGVFTVRVIREHGGEAANGSGDDAMYSTSRMSIVDLAGSERMANTQLTDAARMKEAGNINKSLMNLGHCLEKLRLNQAKAQSLSSASTFGPAAISAKPEVVPFNSSKLTALLKSYFVGEGKTVIIITANPYDGGFYENAQVMKFSATAKDVQQIKNASSALRAAIPRSPTKSSIQAADASIARERILPPSATSPHAQLVIPGDAGEEDITIIEESDDDDEDENPLVDLLITKCEELRQRLYAAETRCAEIEYDVRQEMADEMQRRMADMTDMWSKRMLEEEAMNEQLTNRKLDLLVALRGSGNESMAADTTMASSVLSSEADESLVSAMDKSLASAMGNVALASPEPEPTPLAHRSAIPRLLSQADQDEDDEDSREVCDSPLLKPGRLQPARRAVSSSSPLGSSSDDSQVAFVSAEIARPSDSSSQEQEQEQDELKNSVLSSADESQLSAQSAAEAAASDAEDSETEGKRSGSESESSLDAIVSDDPEDESFEAEDADSSFEDKPNRASSSRKSRASTATTKAAARPSAAPTLKTPRASKAASAKARATPGGAAAAQQTPKPRSTAGSRASRPLAEARASTVNRASAPSARPSGGDVSIGFESQSDASLIAPPVKSVSPKKKRKLRTKSAVDEQTMVEQIGDTSLAEALYSRRR